MPSPRFDDWCMRFPDTIRSLEQMPVTPKQGRTPKDQFWRDPLRFRKVAILATLILTGLISLWLATPLGTVVLADSIPGIDEPETMTWTGTFFLRVTSKDGKRTWIRTERRLFAYRHPGLYRETFLNDEGEVHVVEITDASANRKLVLNLKKRTATLKQTMIDLHDKFLMREIYQPPVRRFLEDHTVPDSFQYVGAGATLGAADRIVCWYQLRGARNFRAIYADLAVRDVDEDALPLKLPR